MGPHLLKDLAGHPGFGQFDKERVVENHGHDRSVKENDERENQVKFIWCHACLFGTVSQGVTGRSSNLFKKGCGTAFDACDSGSLLCYSGQSSVG